jgi:hypothetical protein
VRLTCWNDIRLDRRAFYHRAEDGVTTQVGRGRAVGSEQWVVGVVPLLLPTADCLNQVFAQGLGDGFGLGVNLQLLVDVLEVERDGVDRNIHLASRRLFVMTFDKKFE